MLFIISGPSGVGKGTVISELLSLSNDIALSVSATTRPPRNGEINSESYHFLSHEIFESKIDNDEFLEWCNVHGHYYGTLKSEVLNKLSNHKAIIIEIDVQGAQKIRTQNLPQFHVFLAPPSIDTLKYRLTKRNTESNKGLDQRLETALDEMKQQHLYDEIIVNHELTHTVEKLHNVVLNNIDQRSH